MTGQALSYANPKLKQDWTIVYWIWPVRTLAGSTMYERVTLYIQGNGESKIDVAGLGPVDLKSLRGGLNKRDEIDRRLGTARNFVVAFARTVVLGQKTVVPGPQPVAPTPSGPVLPLPPPGRARADYLNSRRGPGAVPVPDAAPAIQQGTADGADQQTNQD